MDLNEQLRQLVDRGYRVEVKGPAVDDSMWKREVHTMPPQLPVELVLPPDHELLGREVVLSRFWNDGKGYRCMEIRRKIYEGKPELITP
jgi:hypothetical protein